MRTTTDIKTKLVFVESEIQRIAIIDESNDLWMSNKFKYID